MKIFTIENHIDGILCALYLSFTEKIIPDFVEDVSTFQPRFDGAIINVNTNTANSERVKTALYKYGGSDIIYQMKICLMSKEHSALLHAFNYGYSTLKYRTDISDMLSEKAVSDFSYTVQKVLHERHILTGMIRFRESINGVLYAKFSPDNDVVSLIAPHFLKRLGRTPFILHDLSRNKICISDGATIKTVFTNLPANFTPAENESGISELWKKYYGSVNIKERKNQRLQDNFFPRRYRKYCYETWE